MPITVPTPARAIQWAASRQPGSYGFSSAKQSTFSASLEALRLSPVYFHRSVTLDRLGCEVTTAGGAGNVVRLGIYADDGNLHPGALILDAGTVAGDSTGIKELTISQVIPAGVVWVGACPQLGTAPTLRCISGAPPGYGNDAIDVAGSNFGAFHGAGFGGAITGALPTTFTTTFGNSVAGCARIFWRIAA